MKIQKMFFIVLMSVILVPSAAVAGDFDWIKDFNIRAEADPSGFRAQLATRFKIGDAQIDTVLSNVKNPSDAYMVLRLGEMSKQPPDYVIQRYKSNKGKGWGELAKSMGIKPGSEEFHALKRGHNFYDDNDIGRDRDRDRDRGKDKGKGKGKSKGNK
ncbi:MAG: hypothetical protein ABIJ37_07710 [Pseudomonadota bacterium]